MGRIGNSLSHLTLALSASLQEATLDTSVTVLVMRLCSLPGVAGTVASHETCQRTLCSVPVEPGETFASAALEALERTVQARQTQQQPSGLHRSMPPPSRPGGSSAAPRRRSQPQTFQTSGYLRSQRPVQQPAKQGAQGFEPLNDCPPVNLRPMTLRGEWFTSIDLNDTYFHVPIAPHHTQFLRFAFQGRHFQFRVLPFGLSLSPRVFTRCVAAALSPLQSPRPWGGRWARGEWFTSIDLNDTYFHVPIAPHHTQFLRFAFQGRHFQFRVLPFGLSLSPRVFTRCVAAALSPLQSRGMKILPYLDDWLICAPSWSQVTRSSRMWPSSVSE